MKMINFKLKRKDKSFKLGLLKDNQILYLSKNGYLYRYPKSKIFMINDIEIPNERFEEYLNNIKKDILEQDKIQVIHTHNSKLKSEDENNGNQ